MYDDRNDDTIYAFLVESEPAIKAAASPILETDERERHQEAQAARHRPGGDLVQEETMPHEITRHFSDRQLGISAGRDGFARS